MFATSAESLLPVEAAALRPVPVKPTFLSSIVAILGGQAACGLIALLAEVCYARFLGPASRGLISLCLMSVAFGVLVGGLGGEGTIIFWSSASKKAYSNWLPAVLTWALFGCIFACTFWAFVFWRIHPSFLNGIPPACAYLVLIMIPAATLFSYSMSLLTGMEDFRLRSTLALVRQVVGILSFLLLVALWGRKTEAALVANLIAFVVVAVTTVAMMRSSLRGFWKVHEARSSFGPTLSYGLRAQFGNLATFFSYRFDVFLVNFFLGPAQLGLYALGVVISETLWQLPQAAASAIFPRTARTAESEGKVFTCFIMRQVFFISCAGGLLLALACPVFIPLIFGANFKQSIYVIWWILPGTIALSLAKVACSDLAGRGKIGYNSLTAIFCMVATIGLDWVLIPRMGIRGASLASSLAYSCDAVLILSILRHELQVTWEYLLIPTKEEIFSYRAFWFRLKFFLGSRWKASASL